MNTQNNFTNASNVFNRRDSSYGAALM